MAKYINADALIERKYIPSFEGKYEVDKTGRVFNSKTGDELKQQVTTNGYKSVALYKNGKYIHVRVHRAVAMAFIENPNNLPFVNHKDESRTNNAVENLEWCDHQYNINYGTARERQAAKIRGRRRSDAVRENMRVKMKLFQNSAEGSGRPCICLETGERFTSISVAAQHFMISEATVRQSCKRKTKRGRNGLTFRFLCGADNRPKTTSADMRGEE